MKHIVAISGFISKNFVGIFLLCGDQFEQSFGFYPSYPTSILAIYLKHKFSAVRLHQMSLRGKFVCTSLRWRPSLIYPASLMKFGRPYWMCVWPSFWPPRSRSERIETRRPSCMIYLQVHSRPHSSNRQTLSPSSMEAAAAGHDHQAMESNC